MVNYESCRVARLVVGDFTVAAGDATDDAVAFVGSVEDSFGLLDLVGGDDADEADAHVEGAQHLGVFDIAELLEVFEEGWHGPGGAVDERAGKEVTAVFDDGRGGAGVISAASR